MTQLHADAVFLLIGASVGLYFAARAASVPGRAARAAAVLIVVELAQGALGFLQYALAVPELLVALHMLGATVLIIAAVDAWYATRWLPVNRLDLPREA